MEPVRRADGLTVRWWEWLVRPRKTLRLRRAQERLLALRGRPRVDSVSGDVAAARLYDDLGMHEEAEIIRSRHRGRS